MTRLEKILADINLQTQRGLEIGPLVSPIVGRDLARDIAYVDRAPRDELVRWYSVDPKVDTAQIVGIDYVWGDRTLRESVGEGKLFDYCVASHAMEHVPDLASWLQEVSSILAEGGILTLVLPDKRYTFDCLRSLTTAVDVVDAYVNKLRKPSARQIFDHFSHFIDVDLASLWRYDPGELALRPTGDNRNLVRICQEARDNGAYIDSHCWVFTPRSFLDVLQAIADLGLIDFEVARFFPTDEGDMEFFVSLRKLPTALSADEKGDRLRASLAPCIEAADRPVGPHRSGCARCREREHEADVLRTRLESVEAAFRGVTASKSWRLTGPMRQAARAMRRLLRPAD
jgi:SAM-dependent methyltransferase